MSASGVPPRRARVGRNAAEVARGEHALVQRREGDDARAVLAGLGDDALALDVARENVVFALMQQAMHVMLFEIGVALGRDIVRIVGDGGVEGLAALHNVIKGTHCFLDRGAVVRAVVVEEVHIIEVHPLQRLVD